MIKLKPRLLRNRKTSRQECVISVGKENSFFMAYGEGFDYLYQYLTAAEMKKIGPALVKFKKTRCICQNFCLEDSRSKMRIRS